MSLRRLQGWEPRRVTTVERDSRGRIVRYVTETEPEFTPDQMDLLRASREYEAERGPHGFSMTEATSAEADVNNREGSYYFRASGPIRDHAEKARLDAEDAYKAKYGENANLNGAIWTVEKVERKRPRDRLSPS